MKFQLIKDSRRVLRYQRGNQNPYIFSYRCNVLFTIVCLVSFDQCIFCPSIHGLLLSL